MYWTCGQCCVFCMWMVGKNIVIGLYVLAMWLVLFLMYVGGYYNIVIGLCILDMWSVFCVPYEAVGI